MQLVVYCVCVCLNLSEDKRYDRTAINCGKSCSINIYTYTKYDVDHMDICIELFAQNREEQVPLDKVVDCVLS